MQQSVVDRNEPFGCHKSGISLSQQLNHKTGHECAGSAIYRANCKGQEAPGYRPIKGFRIYDSLDDMKKVMMDANTRVGPWKRTVIANKTRPVFMRFGWFK